MSDATDVAEAAAPEVTEAVALEAAKSAAPEAAETAAPEAAETVASEVTEAAAPVATETSAPEAAAASVGPPDSAAIRKQVEYYFSDTNLPRDKFLQTAIAKNEDKWVPIETLCTFNRLKVLSTDAAAIADALAGSELVETSEDRTALRRAPSKPLLDESVISRRRYELAILSATCYRVACISQLPAAISQLFEARCQPSRAAPHPVAGTASMPRDSPLRAPPSTR